LLRLLFLLVLAAAVLELVLLIVAGSVFGAVPVILVLLAGVAAGILTIRHYGMRSLAALQGELQQPGLRRLSLSEGLFGAVAGVLLILPGFISDATAMVLLIPAVQRNIVRRLKSLSPGNVRTGPTPHSRIVVIEGDAVEVFSGSETPDSDSPSGR
jgi:UPF0716 protein FxsA